MEEGKTRRSVQEMGRGVWVSSGNGLVRGMMARNREPVRASIEQGRRTLSVKVKVSERVAEEIANGSDRAKVGLAE